MEFFIGISTEISSCWDDDLRSYWKSWQQCFSFKVLLINYERK